MGSWTQSHVQWSLPGACAKTQWAEEGQRRLGRSQSAHLIAESHTQSFCLFGRKYKKQNKTKKTKTSGQIVCFLGQSSYNPLFFSRITRQRFIPALRTQEPLCGFVRLSVLGLIMPGLSHPGTWHSCNFECFKAWLLGDFLYSCTVKATRPGLCLFFLSFLMTLNTVPAKLKCPVNISQRRANK